MWRRFFGPDNSLILAYDKPDTLDLEELNAQLDHVSAYYQWKSLSEIVGKLQQSGTNGFASVVFLSARKGLFLKFLPEILARDIPITVFADPDLIGTNRLAPIEEIEIYRKKFPHLAPKASLEAARQLGTFPVEESNPLDFSATWGKIMEIPASKLDVGISVSRSMTEGEFTHNAKFVSQRTGRSVHLAYGKSFLSTISEEKLTGLGIAAIVGNNAGVIEKKTSRFDLPQFFFEKTH